MPKSKRIAPDQSTGKMAFAVGRQVLLVLVITAEFCNLFLLMELNHTEDVEIL